MLAQKLQLYTLILALGNAVDAIEINVVGYVMGTLDDQGSGLSTLDKEWLTSGVFIG